MNEQTVEGLKNVNPYDAIGGADRGGRDVVVGGRKIPKMYMYDGGDEIAFVLDSRLMFGFPKELAALAAEFAANAMAIGAGYAHYTMDAPFAPFASKCGPLEDSFPGIELGRDNGGHPEG